MAAILDPSIVWVEDFEDGDADGWETWWREGEYIVEKGVLTFTGSGGDLAHPSTVLYGTWSFDTYIGNHSETSHEGASRKGFIITRCLRSSMLPTHRFGFPPNRTPMNQAQISWI
jgi:hypothetical protein